MSVTTKKIRLSRPMLDCLEFVRDHSPPPNTIAQNTLDALKRRKLIQLVHTPTGRWQITDAGRDWLFAFHEELKGGNR